MISIYEDFEYIKSIEDLNKVTNVDYGWTHFYSICDWNYYNLEVIKYCVENGADFNFKDNFNDTPFSFICCNTKTKEILEYCLDNGADLNIKNQFNNTPFHCICEYNKDLIKYCKPYMNEYDLIKTLKEHNLNWKEYFP